MMSQASTNRSVCPEEEIEQRPLDGEEAGEIFERLEAVEDLPTLPSIAAEMNRLLEDESSSTKELAMTIQKDQAMVSKILRLVNSAFFGLPSKISNISHGLTLLGFSTVRNAVVSISVVEALSRTDKLKGFDIKDFWRHSVAVAVTSRYLASRVRLQAPDECFIAGLLHDTGKVVLACYFPELFQRVWNAMKGGLGFQEAEKQEIPVSHAELGAYLAQRWQLPRSLVETVRFHHAPRWEVQEPHLLFIVHSADILVKEVYENAGRDFDLCKIHPDVQAVLSEHQVSVLEDFPEVAGDIDTACQFFLEGVRK